MGRLVRFFSSSFLLGMRMRVSRLLRASLAASSRNLRMDPLFFSPGQRSGSVLYSDPLFMISKTTPLSPTPPAGIIPIFSCATATCAVRASFSRPCGSVSTRSHRPPFISYNSGSKYPFLRPIGTIPLPVRGSLQLPSNHSNNGSVRIVRRSRVMNPMVSSDVPALHPPSPRLLRTLTLSSPPTISSTSLCRRIRIYLSSLTLTRPLGFGAPHSLPSSSGYLPLSWIDVWRIPFFGLQCVSSSFPQ